LVPANLVGLAPILVAKSIINSIVNLLAIIF
jgi:hypothetical protein